MITLKKQSETTQVEIVKETPKAYLVKGNCSQAWIPKKAIDKDGFLADWFLPKMEIEHTFLFSAPKTEQPLNHR